MIFLLILAFAGILFGGISGLLIHGFEGLIIGVGTGFCASALIWAIMGVIERFNNERRLDRYFQKEGVDSKWN